MLLYRKFHPVVSIFAVVLVMASLLVLTNSFACTKLEFQQDQQTLEILIGVFPEAVYYIYDEEAEIYNVYDMSKNQTGYAFYAKGMGYSGTMTILVGLEDEETINDIFIVAHKDYVRDQRGGGPGDRLNEREFTDQFIGLKIEDCALKQDDGSGGQVDGLTGATTSSRAVVNIVREAALEKVIPRESKMEWQIILVPAIVIPFVLIPVVFIWYTSIRIVPFHCLVIK